jgi:hypothetical protein
VNTALDPEAIRAEIEGIDAALETFDAEAAEDIAKIHQDTATLSEPWKAETAEHAAKVAAARAADRAERQAAYDTCLQDRAWQTRLNRRGC